MDGANTSSGSRKIVRMTLEVFGTVLLFSLAVLIQDIVAQDLAGSTEVNGEAAPVFETMLLVTDTE